MNVLNSALAFSGPAIYIENIRKQYGDFTAVNRLNLQIEQGEFFGLLGPNGAGKSTLINMMAGLTRATEGQVRIMGHDVVSEYRQARRALGVVPQEVVYDPFFSVRKMLRLQSGYFGFGRENHPWIEELIESLDLTDKLNTPLRQLSGGMKRRVLIAQALVHRPAVVVLDEPTAGVDVELRQTLWELTRTLHQQGHTIVLTTHYLEEAEALCDRIAILNNGELKALEDKKSLIARHPGRFLNIILEDSKAELPATINSYVESREGKNIQLRLDDTEITVGSMLEKFQAAGVKIRDIETQVPGLEEVFLDIVAEST